MRYLAKLTLTLGLLLLVACPRKARKVSSKADLPATTEALLARLSADQLTYTTLALSYKGTLLGERRQNFNLRVHLLKDSLIWLSAGLLGIEGVRGLVRSDSAFLIQRLGKVFYYASLDTLRQLFPAYVLSDIANILLGRWPTSLNGLPWHWEPSSGTLTAPYQRAQLRATLDSAPLHLTSWEVSLPTGATLAFTYEWGTHPIPSRITVTLPSDEKILLQLSEFQPHAPDLSFAFRVPSDYKRQPLLIK